MISPFQAVAPLAQNTIARILGVDVKSIDPVVRESNFADLQLNAALALAHAHQLRPFDLAEQIAAELPKDGAISEAYVSKPGYVNIRLSTRWIEKETLRARFPQKLGDTALKVVVDYSSPNVAKEMHVGHLRTTVVGDALVRILEWRGDRVIRQNHIGDWGTPFGMLIEHYLELDSKGKNSSILTDTPNEFYQAARARYDSDEGFAQRARTRVVSLQAGDPDTVRHWERLVSQSRDYFNLIYSALGVSLTDEDLAGESTYNAELAELCEELEFLGLARISEGALCAFPPGFTGRDGNPAPLIIRKSDGGYGYATTDLATIRYRSQTLRADQVIYVVGTPQTTHLEMVWQVAKEAGWLRKETQPVHVKIGNVLGSDNKMLRTRSGESFKLVDLLDEAIQRARLALTSRDDTEADRERAARIIGVGAVKYADLSVGHETEYVFNLDRMVSQNGNTGPYLQYAVTRIRSLLHRVRREHAANLEATVKLELPEERELAMAIIGFEAAALTAAEHLEPHRLCAYLFDLAQRFSSFYDVAPVSTASPDVRDSRLILCSKTEQVLMRGLDLLGIGIPDRM